MKRRSLFLLPLLAFPARLFGQDPQSRSASKTARSRRSSEDDDSPPTTKRRVSPPAESEPEGADSGPPAASNEAIPANFPDQAGFEWKNYPIGEYTSLMPGAASPQTAVIDWIFRRTTPAPWHGDKIAVLCASKTQLRAYNSPKVLKQVADVVSRFTDSEKSLLTVRVRFILAGDSRWRSTIYSRLTPVGSGPQGQQLWFASAADADAILKEMLVWPGSRQVDDKSVEVLNGQTLKFSSVVGKPFTGGVQRDSAVGLGYQPKVEKLEEGIVLRFSPLLTYEGDSLDAAIELSTNVVRKLHTVKVLAPREVGPAEVSLDVPEVSETRLNRPVNNWFLGQTLILSAGVQPGILMDKGGLFNMKIPGTVPTGTEVLVVINVDLVKEKKVRERKS